MDFGPNDDNDQFCDEFWDIFLANFIGHYTKKLNGPKQILSSTIFMGKSQNIPAQNVFK